MEQWKDIPGYESIYQASDYGNIRTCEGKTTFSARHGVRCWKQRIMKQKKFPSNKGRVDARVCLCKDKKETTFLVARLVAMTWCPGYEDGLTVNHIDGNPLNNRADNLEWISAADNIRKGFADGLYSTAEPMVLVDPFGNERSFYSMAEASRFLGYNPKFLSLRMKRGLPLEIQGYKVYPF